MWRSTNLHVIGDDQMNLTGDGNGLQREPAQRQVSLTELRLKRKVVDEQTLGEDDCLGTHAASMAQEHSKRVRGAQTRPGDIRLQKDLVEVADLQHVVVEIGDEPSSVLVSFKSDSFVRCPNRFCVSVKRYYPCDAPIVTCLDSGFTSPFISPTGTVFHRALLDEWSCICSLVNVLEALQQIRGIFHNIVVPPDSNESESYSQLYLPYLPLLPPSIIQASLSLSNTRDELVAGSGHSGAGPGVQNRFPGSHSQSLLHLKPRHLLRDRSLASETRAEASTDVLSGSEEVPRMTATGERLSGRLSRKRSLDDDGFEEAVQGENLDLIEAESEAGASFVLLDSNHPPPLYGGFGDGSLEARTESRWGSSWSASDSLLMECNDSPPT